MHPANEYLSNQYITVFLLLENLYFFEFLRPASPFEIKLKL